MKTYENFNNGKVTYITNDDIYVIIFLGDKVIFESTDIAPFHINDLLKELSVFFELISLTIDDDKLGDLLDNYPIEDTYPSLEEFKSVIEGSKLGLI